MAVGAAAMPIELKRAVDKALADGCAERAKSHRLSPHGRRLRHARRPRCVVARRGVRTERHLRTRMGGCGASSVPALHLGIDRQTQGHPAFQRRISAQCQDRPRAGYSTSRTAMCSGARPTSAGSPGIPTSSTGRWRRAPRSSCTKARRPFPTAGASGRSARRTASPFSIRRPTAIRALMKLGDAVPAQVRSAQAAAARQRR